MKHVILAVCLLASVQAHAATAYLKSCTVGTSATGQPIWIGTYEYAGNVYRWAFPINTATCPVSITVQ